MNNLTLGGLTLCKNKDSEYKWIRADVTPQGWNPVGTTDSDINVLKVPLFGETYIKEVDFK